MVITTHPWCRLVPFASTLLICSGLFMLWQSAPAPFYRPHDRNNACDGTPGLPHSISSAMTLEGPQSPGDDDDDDAPTGSDAATSSGDHVAASPEASSRVIGVKAAPPPFRALDARLLRGPPAGRPDPDDVDDAKDDDDQDDDDNGHSEEGAVPPAHRRNPCILVRADFLQASFVTSGHSLRAPPQ